MKNIKFFKFREYRQMYFRYLKARIKYCLKKPYIYLMALYKTIKLHDLSEWDRYVELKELEKETENRRKKEEKVITYIKFVGTIASFEICLLSATMNKENMEKEYYNNLYSEFNQAKQDFEKYKNQLEEFGVKIPEELKLIFENTEFDKFSNLDEYTEFSKNVHSIIETIQL